MSPAGRQRTARSVGTMLRRSQSQRIGRQEAPDGSKFPTRRRRVLRSQAGIGFVWQGENRRCVTGGPLVASRAHADRL
jgi:phage virion morphogenesis protein